MKTNLLLTVLICLFYNFPSSSQCVDPDIMVISDCGTQFDLCLDEYTIGPDEGVKLEVFVNDDLGIFDPCDTDTLSGTSNGTLTKLADCNWFYQPNSGFYGQDTFYYILNYLDTCIDDCYCYYNGCPNIGRIWTIDAIYLGEDASDNSSYNPTILVKDKFGDVFATHTNLSTGDQFFSDGSSLLPSTTEYTYELYLEGITSQQPDQIEEVHVSCSQEVFGLTFGFLRPISGCIAGTAEKLTCAGVGDTFSEGDELTAETRQDPGQMVSVETADTTMVVITIEPTLAVELVELKAEKLNDRNLISWTLNSYETDRIELQRSTDAKSYETIYQYKPEDGFSVNSYNDYDLQEQSYYRLVFIDQNGKTEYSEVRNISRAKSLTKHVKVFPNPVEKELNIEIPTGSDIHTVILVNSNGQKILERSVDKSTENIKLELGINIPEGLYFVRSIGHGTEEVTKVLKM